MAIRYTIAATAVKRRGSIAVVYAASNHSHFIVSLQQILQVSGTVYVAMCEAELTRMQTDGVVFDVWVVDPLLEWDAEWLVGESAI